MRNLSLLRCIASLCVFLSFYSCTKDVRMVADDASGAGDQQLLPAMNLDARVSALSSGNDTVETATVLGVRLPNPYITTNMRQAYINITGQTSMPAVTNLYVKFKPANLDQLKQLDSIMEARNLDLFDTPLDYQVTQEGDYYQDPSIPMEQITWLYAVVTPSFVFPAGIPYQTIASIHIPTNTRVEQEAERLAGLNADGDGLAGSTLMAGAGINGGVVQPNSFPVCPEGYYYNEAYGDCLPLTSIPPDPVAVPKGRIMVFDTQLDLPAEDNVNATETQPLRNLRVVAKRWFKIERTFTDNNGNFQVTKNFRKKVKLIVKFKNQFSTVRNIALIRLWEILTPLDRQIGIFSGSTINNVRYTFTKGTEGRSQIAKYWMAATVHNAALEQRDYCTQFGIAAPSSDINIYLTRFANTSGSAPLFHKRYVQNLPASFVNNWLVFSYFNIAGGTTALIASVLRHNVDVVIGYDREHYVARQSDNVKETAYHEMSHVSHYSRAGTSWYNNFVTAELAEIQRHPTGSLTPYGTGNTAESPIIAVGEGWAYFIGLFLANQKYNIEPGFIEGSNNFNLQLGGAVDLAGNVLESFRPTLLTDPFRWIPAGLMEDLRDANNEPSTPVVDGVSNFTIQQLFNPLQSDVSTMQAYRTRLIQQNPNNQTANVTALFGQYNY